MGFQFRPARRGQTPIMLGLAGPSRSGKTYSALRIATGLAQGGPIYGIDTESGRMLQYADRFQFIHGPFGPPFSSDRYMEGVQAAAKAGAAVIIVDSASHEHEGQGGILEQHDVELSRMAGDDTAKRERLKFTAWIKPKAAHNRYVNTILQVNTHMIFCFRAKDKLALVRGAKGKVEPVPVGWVPICTDRFEYEMTGMLMLPPGSKGIPDFDSEATSLREPLDTIIRRGEQLDEALGQRLAEWARGDAAAGTTPAPNESDIFGEARAAAERGRDAFTAWWQGAGKTPVNGQMKRSVIKPRLPELRAIVEAVEADDGDEDPFGLPPSGQDRGRDGGGETEARDAEGEATRAHPPEPGSEDADSAGRPPSRPSAGAGAAPNSGGAGSGDELPLGDDTGRNGLLTLAELEAAARSYARNGSTVAAFNAWRNDAQVIAAAKALSGDEQNALAKVYGEVEEALGAAAPA